jgi:Mrp family chromosome partitioning ATPase
MKAPLTSVDTGSQEDMKNDQIADMAEFALKTQGELDAHKLIYPGMRQRDVLNSFRDLRTKLLQKSEGKNFVLMVSALNRQGGSSFVASNIAASLAIDERKTAVYVDCNVEDPFADGLLADTPEHGVMEYLRDRSIEIKDVIYSSGLQRFRIIPAGKSSERAVELLASPRMTDFVTELRSRYPDRFIILDVPPISESAVARVMSQAVDMAVLVVPFGKVTPNQVLAGVDAVSQKKLAGLVFNN